MQLTSRFDRLDGAARRCNEAVILSEGRGNMVTDKTLRCSPDERIALVENLASLLLHGWIGEELIQSVHTVPEIEDQKFAGSLFGRIHGHVYHMAHIAEGLGRCDIGGCAGGRVVELARGFQGSGGQRSTDGEQKQRKIVSHGYLLLILASDLMYRLSLIKTVKAGQNHRLNHNWQAESGE